MLSLTRHSILTLILGQLTVFLMALPAEAAGSCRDLFRVERRGGTAVELEMNTTAAVMNILTTSDGTVGGLVGRMDVTKIPASYTVWAKSNYPQIDPLRIDWELLSPKLKFELFKFASINSRFDFTFSRTVPNIEVKDVITMTFTRPTLFMGTQYARGTYQVNIADYFGVVEYVSPKARGRHKSVELHLRSDTLDSGELLESAWAFQRGIGASRTDVHVHIIVPVPQPSKTSPTPYKDIGLSVAENYRRTNLLFELISILQGYEISQVKDENSNIRFFDSIDGDYISGVYKYMSLPRRERNQTLLGSRFKMGWVGFRDADTYEQLMVYGYEVRSIGALDDSPGFQKILNKIQWMLITENYGFEVQDMWAHMKKSYVLPGIEPAIIEYLEHHWYKMTQEFVESQVPDYLEGALGPNEIYLDNLDLANFENQAVKMLFYNWRGDFLFFDATAAEMTKLKSSQYAAAKQFFKTPENLTEILQKFIKESGLFDRVAAPYNLTPAEVAALIKG